MTIDVDFHAHSRDSEVNLYIDPAASPKTIDLKKAILHTINEPNWQNPTALGIYEVDGNRMRLCIAGERAGLKQQYPKQFAATPESANILVTLERDHPSEEELAIKGNWHLISLVVNGNLTAKDDLNFYCSCDGYELRLGESYGNVRTPTRLTSFMKDWPEDSKRLMILDAASSPKAINLRPARPGRLVSWGPNLEKEQMPEINGIYTLEKDRLTIAYRADGPMPRKVRVATRLRRDADGARKAAARVQAGHQEKACQKLTVIRPPTAAVPTVHFSSRDSQSGRRNQGLTRPMGRCARRER